MKLPQEILTQPEMRHAVQREERVEREMLDQVVAQISAHKIPDSTHDNITER